MERYSTYVNVTAWLNDKQMNKSGHTKGGFHGLLLKIRLATVATMRRIVK